MGRLGPPEKRTKTPFLDGARNGDSHQSLLLSIAIAHGIIDESQATNVDSEMLAQQVGKVLNPTQIKAALASLAGGDEAKLEKLTASASATQWAPGGKKSRVAKNK